LKSVVADDEVAFDSRRKRCLRVTEMWQQQNGERDEKLHRSVNVSSIVMMTGTGSP
jgi:hypothetical protein